MEEKEMTRKEKRQAKRAARKANRKPFFQTGVGIGLKTVASLVAPNLVNALDGIETVGEALGVIRNSDEGADVKAQLQEFTLAQYELEVEDRLSARDREVRVLEAGGNNMLMNVLGWGVTLCFIGVALTGLGIINIPEDINRDYLMFASGSIVSAFMTVLAYYFGSSVGSKQKTHMMNE